MNRSEFLKILASGLLLPPIIQNLNTQSSSVNEETSIMPALFLSTGSQKNLFEENDYTQKLQELGKKLPIPKAILFLNSTWGTNGIYITTSAEPEMLHEYVGMDEKYYELKYAFKGDADISQQIIQSLDKVLIQGDMDHGIDTGAWGLARLLFPEGNIPIIEMSTHIYSPPSMHLELGKKLKALREKGILVIGTGNIVQNQRYQHKDRNAAPFPWARAFDEFVKENIKSKDYENIVQFRKNCTEAKQAVTANQQIFPLLSILGMIGKNDKVEFIHEGFENACISLRSLMVSNNKV